MRKRIAHLAIVLICIRLAVGCATTFNGASQKIMVVSSPESAEVWVDSVRVGTTPAEVTLRRSEDHVISLKKEGFKEVTITIESHLSEWLIGNVWFGFWPGCIVDVASGGAYQLEPERLDIDLGKIGELEGATIYIDQAQLDSVRYLGVLDDDGNVETIVNITWVE